LSVSIAIVVLSSLASPVAWFPTAAGVLTSSAGCMASGASHGEDVLSEAGYRLERGVED